MANILPDPYELSLTSISIKQQTHFKGSILDRIFTSFNDSTYFQAETSKSGGIQS
jgi:hypothetical protein